MNPDTGHLIDLHGKSEEEIDELIGLGYVAIPDELVKAARRKLAGKKEANVSLKSGGKLSRWASMTRKQRKRLGIKSYKDFCQ
jgi:hypothetical protein